MFAKRTIVLLDDHSSKDLRAIGVALLLIRYHHASRLFWQGTNNCWLAWYPHEDIAFFPDGDEQQTQTAGLIGWEAFWDFWATEAKFVWELPKKHSAESSWDTWCPCVSLFLHVSAFYHQIVSMRHFPAPLLVCQLLLDAEIMIMSCCCIMWDVATAGTRTCAAFHSTVWIEESRFMNFTCCLFP